MSKSERLLRDLLAIIHRDGGHYLARNGQEKACADAEKIVVQLRQELAEARVALGDLGSINSALTWIRWEEEHAAALKAARDGQ
jgi:hypothetical protein